MKSQIKTTLQFIIALLLITTFITSIGVGIFTWYLPDRVISLIQSLRPEKASESFQIKGVAVLGDSQSDEYRADDGRGKNFDTVTYNWVEVLQKERNINFGKWGVWDEPRRTGYAYNWARSGATAESMIVSGQHIGVADQIKKGEVNTVIVYIGANDYAPFITGSGYDAIYNGTLSEADSIKKRNDIISDIKTALEVLENAGDVEIILVAIPHWSNNFGISLAFPIPERRKYVVTAVTDTNKAIKELAQEHNIPVIDPNDFYTKITGENNGSIVVGGIKLERLLINNDPKNMFLDDGIHPGTVINMLFANEVISTLNSSFGTNFREFTDEEILKISGINR